MFLLSQFQCATSVSNGRRHRDLLLGVSLEGGFGHGQEGFLDAVASDCTRLVEHHIIVFLGPCLSLGGGHLSASLLIKLVSEAHEGERVRVTGASILNKACLPAAQVVK